MTMEHKHASVLRAIADGVPLSEFEARGALANCWSESLNGFSDWIANPDLWEIRRKPQYIMVNGFKVPKPLEAALKVDSVFFYVSLDSDNMYEKEVWTDHNIDLRMVERGIAHTTKEAAIAHAKAMLGIDPKWEE